MSHQQITSQAHILQAIVLTSIGRNKQMLPQANFLQANIFASKCLQANIHKQSRQANVKQANIMSPILWRYLVPHVT